VVLKVPAVFVIENNFYSEHTSIHYAVGTKDLKARTEAFGFPVFVADGSDFFAVHEAAGKAISHARAGNGPAGVFCEMGRFYGHFVGDPEGYRSAGEVKRLRQDFCCLKNFRASMEKSGGLGTAELDAVDAEVGALIDRAVAAARAAPRPTAADVTRDVYVNY
jgi:pyruvate dehydrogenase E1 component alpha subunit